MTYSSVAILVDGDNVSSQYAGQILRRVAHLGEQRHRLAFCNAQSMGVWASAPSFRVVGTGTGKNGTDIQLSIEAMEIALRDRVEAMVIVSSDRDLSRIAHKLREYGVHVFGMGEEKTPSEFVKACSKFERLTPPQAKIEDDRLSRIDRVVRGVLHRLDPKGAGVPLARLNADVRKADNSIMISKEPEKNWPKYLSERPDLYEIVGPKGARRVRISAVRDEN